MYKSINNLNPVYLNDLFTRVNSVHFTPGSVLGLSVSSTMTVCYGSHSIKHFGTIFWNSLPFDFQTAENINTFRNKLLDWKGALSKCAKCGD